MKTMNAIKIILTMCCVAAITAGLAQERSGVAPLKTVNNYTYKTAIGLRAGGTSGITIKHFVNQDGAIEGIVGLWPNAISATVLYERYATAFEVYGLNWYYGIGGHAAFETDEYYNEGRKYDRGDKLGIGIDGILGLEYKIHPIPFAVSFDLKPFIEFNTNGHIYTAMDPGLGIKFTF